METIKKNINKIITAIVLVFIITFAFNYIKGDESGDIVEKKINNDQEAMEMLETLNELNKIKIDTSFFEEDLGHSSSNLISFSELEDFSKYEIVEKPIGKLNPFVAEDGTESNPEVIDLAE